MSSSLRARPHGFRLPVAVPFPLLVLLLVASTLLAPRLAMAQNAETPDAETPDAEVQHNVEEGPPSLLLRSGDTRRVTPEQRRRAQRLLRRRLQEAPERAARRASPSGKTTLPSDIYTIDYVERYVYDADPDDTYNFNYVDRPMYAGDVNGDGTGDYLQREEARDDRTTDNLADQVWKTAVFFGASQLDAKPDQVVYTEGPLYPVGNFNGDAYADAIAALPSQFVLYEGTSSGYQKTTTTLPREGEGRIARGFSDLDGDGTDDLLLGDYYLKSVEVVFGAEDPDSPVVQVYPFGSTYTNNTYATGDVNEDGRAEMVMVDGDLEDDGALGAGVYHLNRDGTVTTQQSRFLVEEFGDLQNDQFLDDTADNYALWLLDLTGNGTRELLVKEGGSNTYFYEPGTEDASTWAFSLSSTSPVQFSTTPIELARKSGKDDAAPVGDLNGDGRHDFYTYDEATDTYYVSFGPSSLSEGALTHDVEIPFADGTHGEAYFLHEGRIGDVTGDGQVDVPLSFNRPDEWGRRLATYDSGGMTTVEVTRPEEEFSDRTWSLVSAGDVGGGPEDDLARSRERTDGLEIFFGGTGFDLSEGAAPDVVLNGEGSGGVYDQSFGDVNGDGARDVIVGHAGTGSTSSVAIHLGGSGFGGAPDHSLRFDDFAPDGYDDGFTTPTVVGDLNDDGADDVMVAAYFSDLDGSYLNEVYVVYGGSSILQKTQPDAVIDYKQEFGGDRNLTGEDIAAVGDVNGDGIDDVAVGISQLENADGSRGRVDVFYGSSTGIDASSPDAMLLPPSQESSFGVYIAGGADFNGDGRPDLAVRAYSYRSADGGHPAYVYHGGETSFDTTPDHALDAPRTATLRTEYFYDFDDDGLADRIYGTGQFVGDPDRDGYDDFVIGTFFQSNAVAYRGGTAADVAPSAVFDSPNPDGALGGGGSFAAGDFNANGTTDVLFSQVYDDNDARSSSRVYHYETSTLPVDLAGFDVQVDDQAAVLTWTTASETDNAGFEVQHRRPGTSSFRTVAFVEGAGTTQAPQNYRHRTGDLAPGTHTFRLKQVDADGGSSLSKTDRVEVRLADRYRVTRPAPNPSRGEATMIVQVRSAQPVTAVLYDALGRKVRTLHDGRVQRGERLTLTPGRSGLASGSYFIRVHGPHFTTTRRLTIVR